MVMARKAGRRSHGMEEFQELNSELFGQVEMGIFFIGINQKQRVVRENKSVDGLRFGQLFPKPCVLRLILLRRTGGIFQEGGVEGNAVRAADPKAKMVGPEILLIRLDSFRSRPVADIVVAAEAK